jgi:hypothetical protein
VVDEIRLHQYRPPHPAVGFSFAWVLNLLEAEKAQLYPRIDQSSPAPHQEMVDVRLQFEIRQEAHKVCC